MSHELDYCIDVIAGLAYVVAEGVSVAHKMERITQSSNTPLTAEELQAFNTFLKWAADLAEKETERCSEIYSKALSGDNIEESGGAQ